MSSESSSGAGLPGRPGRVQAAAVRHLEAMGSAHPAAGLLIALAVRFAAEVDSAKAEPRDRLAAGRMVLDIVTRLDNEGSRRGQPGPTSDTEVEPDPQGDPTRDDTDPFNVGDLPPGVGDPA